MDFIPKPHFCANIQSGTSAVFNGCLSISLIRGGQCLDSILSVLVSLNSQDLRVDLDAITIIKYFNITRGCNPFATPYLHRATLQKPWKGNLWF